MAASKTIGLLGCGTWGQKILRDLVQLDARVVVVEPDERCRGEALAGGAAEVLETAEQLTTVDGFIVATPATTHADVIERISHYDVPIFTEKPFTTDVESARRLAKRFAGRLFIMHVWRYHRGIEMLRDVARSQELGPVRWLRSTRANWTSPRKDVDPLWTLMPHDLSIALEILGRIPEPGYAVAEDDEKGPSGLLAVLGEAPAAVLEVSTRYGDKRREVRLHCRDGVAVLKDGDASFIELLRKSEDDDTVPLVEKRRFPAEPPLMRELRTFLDHLSGGQPPRSSAAEGLAVVSTMVKLRALAGV